MNLSFEIKPPPGDSELRKLSLARKTLRQGDRLQGNVVDLKNNGKVLVDFGKYVGKLASLSPDEFRQFGANLQKVVSYNESLPIRDKMPKGLIDALKKLSMLTAPLTIEGHTAQLASDLKSLIENINHQQHAAINKMMVHEGPKTVTYSAPIIDHHLTDSYIIIKEITKMISILKSFKKIAQISTEKDLNKEIENLLEIARRLT